MMGLSASSAMAQKAPDPNDVIRSIAGDTMRNIGDLEQNRLTRQRQSQIETYPPEWVIDSNDLTEWLILGIEVRGNHKIRSEALLLSLKPYLNKRITLNRVRELVDVVAQQYQAAGIEARVYFPKQKLGRPKMLIQVIETTPSGKP